MIIICISVVTNDVGHLFVYLLIIRMASLVKYGSNFSLTFKNLGSLLFSGFINILCEILLSEIRFANISSNLWHVSFS